MTELQIFEFQQPGKISFNYEALKAEIEEKARAYELTQYTEDTVKLAKEDRANLNRLKKALNDERLRREKEFMAPFLTFKTQINDLIAIIDKPVGIIDSQVKSFEEAQKKQKADYIKAWYTANRELLRAPLWLEISKIANPKWSNASVKTKEIQEEIKQTCDRINADIATLEALPEFSFEALTVYKQGLDLNAAINEGRRMAEIQKRKAEAEAASKAAEEAKRAAEALEAAESAKTAQVAQLPTEAEKTPPEAAQRATEAKTEQPKTQEAHWVTFEAFLNREQALALRDFLKDNEIQFRAAKKGE